MPFNNKNDTTDTTTTRDGGSSSRGRTDLKPTATVHAYGLRNSCDLCYSSKLRCSGEKPACARCRKSGVVCTFAPNKRPGRPRKSTQSRSSVATSAAGNGGSTIEVDQMPLDQPAMLQWSPSAAPSDDQLQVLPMDLEWTAEHSITFLDDNFDLTVNGLDYLDGIPSTTILGTCPSIDGSTAQRSPLSSAGHHPQSPHEVLLSSRDGDDWGALDRIGDISHPKPLHITHAEGECTEPSPQNDFNGSIELSSASCLPDSPQFFEWCRSFKQWVSDHHSLLFVNRTTIGQDSKPDKSCLCHMALITLQLQRKDTYNIQPEGTLEASMYLQRLLEWTWNQNKNCLTCHEDDLAKFIVASVANDVVGIYRRIIAEDEVIRCGATNDPVQPRPAKRRVFSLDRADEELLLSQQGLKAHLNLRQMTETTKTSLLGRTTLTFGTKPIDGVAKTAFLRRLIGLKLRQIGQLVQELSSDERAVEPSRGLLAQTLRVLVPGVLDNVNVITGMIQTDL